MHAAGGGTCVWVTGGKPVARHDAQHEQAEEGKEKVHARSSTRMNAGLAVEAGVQRCISGDGTSSKGLLLSIW